MKLVLLLAAAGLLGAGNSKFLVWNPAELKGYEKTLHAKMGPDRKAILRLDNVVGDPIYAVHREATAPAEYHEKYGHLIYVISGEATLVVGGKLAGKQTSSPDPIPDTTTLSADSLTGGESRNLAAGDVIQIPPEAPHWFKVADGKQITYLMWIVYSK